MFGLFGKKARPKTLMDEFVKATYGDNPPRNKADVAAATNLASDDLLGGAFDKAAVSRIATELSQGPMPYSTHDLAASVALSVFKQVPPADRSRLMTVQMMARLTNSQWAKEGKVNKTLAMAFEQTLYRDYKP